MTGNAVTVKSSASKNMPGFDLVQAQGHGRLVAAQDDAVQQVMDAVERGAPAEDIQFLDRLPAQKCAEQPAQPEDVIEMSMREQNACQILEADA